MRWKWIFLAPLAILGMLLFVALGGEVVRLLWNWLVPSIVGWREITFWQALGLLALCRILFGGWGSRGFRGPRPHFGKSSRMTPEERQRYRERMRERFGCGRFTGEDERQAPQGPTA